MEKKEAYREIIEKGHQERVKVLQMLKQQLEDQISEINSIEDPVLKMNALETATKIYKSLY